MCAGVLDSLEPSGTLRCLLIRFIRIDGELR